MAQYDASIRINTEINTQNASSQLMTLKNRIVKTVDKIASLRAKMDALKSAQVPTQAYQNLEKELASATKEMERMLAQDSKLAETGNKIQKLSQSSAEYAAKMREVAGQKIPTQEYTEIQKQIESTKKKIDDLQARQERFLETGGKSTSSAYKRMEYDIEQLKSSLPYMESELQDLIDTGKAFTLGTDTEQYKNLSAKYEQVNQELEKQKGIQSEIANKQAESVQKVMEIKAQMQQLVEEGRAFQSGAETEEYAKLSQQLKYAQNDLATLNQRHKELEERQGRNADGYKRLGKTARDGAKTANKAVKGMSDSLKVGFKNILKYGLGIRSFYALINKIRTGIKEGFSNLYNDANMTAFKNSVDDLRASVLTLKNAFAAAFRPLVDIAIPYIQLVSDKMIDLLDMVGQFTATFSGQKTYTRAIRQTADAFKDAEKAAKGYLSPLDEINKYSTGQDEEERTDVMFEEVPISQKFLNTFEKLKDAIKPALDYAEKLKDIFKQGFFDGIGDWGYRWDSIKDSIKSIKDSLKDIFSDPKVLAAADKWEQSVAYLLGSLAGSVASIGLTIATNLLGGIAKYLEQNKERIKKYLISMFDIWSEINYLFADLFQSIAYVFESFASEQGQQLTANIIGIFVDTFMGITELASKIFRDISQIIIKPFVDNKEAFRVALEGFLGVLASITGTIKDGIDATFDKLNEVYDTHFKPFFDSVAQGLSDLVGRFMEFWNGTIQPILEEWAGKFDTLWKEHIQPFLNSIAELIGSVADLLKTLWEQVLQPFIQWIIDNILPIVMPIIQSIYNTLITVIGDIADLLTGFVNTVKGIIDLIVALINGDWSSAWEAAKSIVENIFNMIFSFTQTIIDSLLGVIDVGLQTILGIFEATFQGIFDFVSKIWNDMQEYTTSFFEWIGNHIDNALTDIKGVWDNIWDSFTEKVTSIWENIKNIVSGAIENIKSWVSGLFSVFGSVSSKAGSLSSRGIGFEGSSFSTTTYSFASPAMASLSSMEIPKLATGAVIPANKEFLAVLGDQKRGTNVEAPLDTIKQAQKESLMEVLSELGLTGGSKAGSPQTITLQVVLDKKVLGQTMVDWGKIQQMATGNNPYALGTT